VKLHHSDIVAIFRKHRVAEGITILSSLTRNYIAWQFLFGYDVINTFERKASAFIVRSVQPRVSYMPSCGRTKLYHHDQCRDGFAQSLSKVAQIVFTFFAHKKCLMLVTKVLTLHSLLFKWKGGVSCATRLVVFV